MFFISKHWRCQKLVYGLLILEFPFTVANLALFGIASPNLYRTKLWQEGGDLGLNSAPLTIVYAYANYKPVKIPLVWSQFQTNFNLIIGVLSMFILLCKVTMYITHVFYPLVSLIVHGILVALWAISVHAQTAPDTIDPARSNHGPPWYITKSCSIASSKTLEGYCQQAKSAFAVTVVMLALFSFHVILAIWSMIPTKEQKAARASKIMAEKEKEMSPSSDITTEQHWQQQWELQQFPRSPYLPYAELPVDTPGTTGGMKSPMTPRTLAFNNLAGGSDLPLREHRFQPFPA